MKLLTSTLKLNEAAMINANAMDAKGITNDLPLSLSISTESTLKPHRGPGILEVHPLCNCAFQFHFNMLCVCVQIHF